MDILSSRGGLERKGVCFSFSKCSVIERSVDRIQHEAKIIYIQQQYGVAVMGTGCARPGFGFWLMGKLGRAWHILSLIHILKISFSQHLHSQTGIQSVQLTQFSVFLRFSFF